MGNAVKVCLSTLCCGLLFLSLSLPRIDISKGALVGAWGYGSPDHRTVMINTDRIFSVATYDVPGKKFISSYGGTWRLQGNKLITQIEWNSQDSGAVGTEIVEEIKEAEYHDIDPIILTPQILQKCGFRNFIRDEWIISHTTGHADFDLTPEGLRLRHPTPSRRPIKYLHQLQNFFFALTGEEIEVNL